MQAQSPAFDLRNLNNFGEPHTPSELSRSSELRASQDSRHSPRHDMHHSPHHDLGTNEYQEIRVESSEKLALHNDKEHAPSGLDVRYLIIAYGGLALALLLFIPKIWLSSSIYYISRDISKLQTQSDLLKEENRRLQNERENLRYQYLKAQANPQGA